MNSLLDLMAADDRDVVLACGEFARQRGGRAFLVGGIVRDLLLGVVSPDIDILVDGDAIAVAQDLARAEDGEVQRYHAFQTATVTLPDGRRIDFARARAELSRKRGALPEVTPGTLQEDLARRDFTINSLALPLEAGGAGELVDPFDGEDDLRNGLVRFLHEQSFSDDPTRILRGLRFALRLGYEIEPRTAAAIVAAAQGAFLGEVSGDRLRRELGKLLGEQPVAGPAALVERNLLGTIFPGLVVDAEGLGRLVELRAEIPELIGDALAPWATLAVMAARLDPQQRWDLARRLRLPREEQRVVVESGAAWDRAASALGELSGATPPSAVAEVLDRLPVAVVAVGFAGLRDEDRRERVREYLHTYRSVRPWLDGDGLLELGCPPGPQMGAVLRALRNARMDGTTIDAAGERVLAAELIAGEIDGPGGPV